MSSEFGLDGVCSETVLITDSDKTSETGNSDATFYRLYKRRYFLVFVASVSVFLNSELWYNIPASTIAYSEFMTNNSTDAINWLSNMFFLIYVITAVPFAIIAQRIGFKKTIFVGNLLNFMATLTRILAFSIHTPGSPYCFYVVLLSNLLASLSQGFSYLLPVMISNAWFDETQKEFSLSCSVMGDVLGSSVGALSLYLPISYFPGHIKTISIVVSIVETAISLTILILSSIYAKEFPKFPPSKAAVLEYRENERLKRVPAMKEMKQTFSAMFRLLKTCSGMFLMVIYAFYYALPVAFYTFIDEILYNYFNLDEDSAPMYISYAGFISFLLGGVSAQICGHFLDRYRGQFRKPIAVFLLGSCGLCTLIMCFVRSSLGSAQIFILILIFGTLSTPFWAYGVQMITEHCYPAPITISNNMALWLGNLFSVILIYLPALAGDEVLKVRIFFILSSVSYFLSALLFIFVPFKNIRVEKSDI